MEIDHILKVARDQRASDIHIVSGAPVLLRIDGELVPTTREPLSTAEAKRLAYGLLTPEQVEEFEHRLDIDLMKADAERHRYRVNVSYNDGAVGAVIRLLAADPLPLEKLHLPELVAKLCSARKGLILITGSTSQGKTTTLAGMIDAINRHSRKHVITIEDPIEYVHANKRSVIRQREIGKDTRSFNAGLRAALRQDPDVIAIGEMRDYETIKIALTAAETGVLVLSTLHIISIDKIVERLLAYAPDGGDGHMRALLAEALLAVIHQELLPTTSGGKRAACETLFATDAVRNVLRKRGTFHLRNQIATGQKYGMQMMKTSVDLLRDQHIITDEVYAQVMEYYR